MKIKYFFWAINTTLDFIFSLYHEFWHWLFGTFVWIFSINIIDRPKLYIDRYPSCHINEDGGLTSYSSSMSIRYTSDGPSRYRFIISFAPAIGCIFLFIVSPWYMYLLYIPYINTLWLSVGDVNKLNN